jgi:hypothetical protein
MRIGARRTLIFGVATTLAGWTAKPRRHGARRGHHRAMLNLQVACGSLREVGAQGGRRHGSRPVLAAAAPDPEGGARAVTKDPRVYLAHIFECVEKIELFTTDGKGRFMRDRDESGQGVAFGCRDRRQPAGARVWRVTCSRMLLSEGAICVSSGRAYSSRTP